MKLPRKIIALAALLLTPLVALHAANSGASASVSPPTHRGLYATFLMERLPDHTREVKNAGPDDQRFGAWARLLPRDQTLQLVLDDSFAASLATQAAEIRVTYLDRGTGAFDVQAAGQTFQAQCSDSGRWKTVAWEMSHSVFPKTEASAHVSLRALGEDLIVHMVEVARK